MMHTASERAYLGRLANSQPRPVVCSHTKTAVKTLSWDGANYGLKPGFTTENDAKTVALAFINALSGSGGRYSGIARALRAGVSHDKTSDTFFPTVVVNSDNATGAVFIDPTSGGVKFATFTGPNALSLSFSETVRRSRPATNFYATSFYQTREEVSQPTKNFGAASLWILTTTGECKS